jgi:formate hydrogenlyase transcriptional activator
MSREGMESLCAMPLLTGGRERGVLFFMAAAKAAYEGVRRGLLEEVAGEVAVALDDCLAHEEIQQLRDQLAAENVYLQEEIRQDHNFEETVGASAALRRALQEVELVAPTESTVLIYGETGTGKELVARAIHARSRRADRPLIKVNCAAIPAGLVESELFGHEKGAFTGALERRIGRFELAHGGTIFLDEVGELPVETQVKLLRVLQEREFERVGGSATLQADVRVIAATNRDLHKEIGEGRFRQDLYYRLSVFPLTLPPLRERPGDIELLAHYFLQRHARRLGREVSRISAASLEQLRAYAWPGNVRELENAIERALILSPGPVLEIGDRLLPGAAPPLRAPAPAPAPDATAAAANVAPSGDISLAEVERQHLLRVLESCHWVIEGPQGAGRRLGLHPNTLRSRLKKLGLRRPGRAGDD